MATLDSLVSRCLQEAPGLPKSSALSVVRRVAREFFIETGAWKKEVPYSLPIDTAIVDLSGVLSAGTTISNVIAIHKGLTPLREIPLSQLVKIKASSVNYNEPRFYAKNIQTIEVYPSVSVVTELTFLVNLTLTADSNYIDDDVELNFRDAIVFGALFNLLMQKNKPWSDPQGSMDYRQRYFSLKSIAKTESISEHNTARFEIPRIA